MSMLRPMPIGVRWRRSGNPPRRAWYIAILRMACAGLSAPKTRPAPAGAGGAPTRHAVDFGGADKTAPRQSAAGRRVISGSSPGQRETEARSATEFHAGDQRPRISRLASFGTRNMVSA